MHHACSVTKEFVHACCDCSFIVTSLAYTPMLNAHIEVWHISEYYVGLRGLCTAVQDLAVVITSWIFMFTLNA
jgi:hypothetical protein